MAPAIANTPQWPRRVAADNSDYRHLRVAHLLPNLAIGGRERIANALCEVGNGQGLSSILIGYDPLPDDLPSLSPLAPYHQLDRQTPGFAASLGALLKAQQIDVVHAQGHIPAIYLAQALSEMPRRPASLATMHIGLQGTRRWLWAMRQGLRAMDGLTAVSRDLAQTYGRIAGRPVTVVANGIDCRDFAAINPRHQHGEPFRFAMLSRLDRGKCHASAVRAADRLIAAGCDAELHIAGTGECRPELVEMATTRPWLILAGAVADPAAFLRGKHAFLLPSREEGMPLALAEAMASGLPAIVSDLPALRDMAGEAVRYVAVGNEAALAAAMHDLIRDPASRSHLARLARHRAQAFDIQSVSHRYHEFYRALANHSTGCRAAA